MKERSYWLKSVGPSREEIEESGLTEAGEMRFVGFPNRGRPSISGLDYLVYHAAGYFQIYGIVEVFMPPTRDGDEKRWPWRCEVRPRLMLDSLERAPSTDVLSPEADIRKSVRQQSHIRLTETTYEAALTALAIACEPEKGDYLTDYWPFRDAAIDRRRLAGFVREPEEVEFLTNDEAGEALAPGSSRP